MRNSVLSAVRKSILGVGLAAALLLAPVSGFADEGLSTDADCDGVAASTAAPSRDGLDTDSDGVAARHTANARGEVDNDCDGAAGHFGDSFFDIDTRPSPGVEPDEIDAANAAAVPGVEPDEIDDRASATDDGGSSLHGEPLIDIDSPGNNGADSDEEEETPRRANRR